MKNMNRWEIAQESEKKYWKSRAYGIEVKASADLQWYDWRAKELKRIFNRINQKNYTDGEKRILEIGCGPVGLISFFPGKYKVGIDPLNEYYTSKKSLVEVRDKDVVYMKGAAEHLIFEAESFDLVVTENCIDHVKDLSRAMSEIFRVLRKGGILYLTVNCRSRIGYFVHRLLSKYNIDKSHPHTFTLKRILDMLRSYQLDVMYYDELGSYKDALISDLKSKSKRDNLKALSGVSEFLVRTLSKKGE
jgi:SAM-dependent methyltransferase